MAEKRVFVLQGKEAEQAEAWIEKHKETCNEWRPTPHHDEFGFSAFSYKFTIGSVGTGISVTCNCGAEEDVTDFESF